MKIKIGIFDSGIGGFTILNSLLKTRKDVEVFYLADTKRIPFGSKNFKEIRLIAKDICNFFVDKNLDALLVACNTTNACALDILEKGLMVPCFDLINSVSEIVNKTIIGVFATQTTVESSYYKKAISSKKENIDFYKLDILSDMYLKPLLNKNIEELILGCSHYPLIYDLLRKKIDPKIRIIDPSKALIKRFNESFDIPKTYRYESLPYENVQFFVTADKDEFAKKVKFWLEVHKEIRLVNLRSNV